jgi:hypothetical protein
MALTLGGVFAAKKDTNALSGMGRREWMGRKPQLYDLIARANLEFEVKF